MSYSCLEELQVDLDLHMPDKTSILSKVGCQCNEGWFVITDDGICHLFDRNGNLDDITKITQLTEEYIRQDITKIVIPDSIISIGNYAFFNCSKLTSMTIPDSVKSIGDWAFKACRGLTSMTIPNSVTSIGYATFCDCHGLTDVTISNSMTSIGYAAFTNCSRLTNVVIPNNVTNIESAAFWGCSSLTSVTIGRGVKSIGTRTFSLCNNLTNLIFKDKTLKQVKKMTDYPWGIKDESIIRVG